MSEPDGFLSRWSRRKRAAAEPDPAAEQQFELQEISEPEVGPAPGDKTGGPESGKEEQPAFDLSKLPPIESITAETDIRAFLAPGVPPELTQAALRRAWVMDPKIRDFIEMAENQWDFTVTGGAPGFDLSPPIGDIAQMLKQVLPRSTDESAAEAKTPADVQAELPPAEPAPHSIVKAPDENEPASGSDPEQKFVRPREIAEVRETDSAPQKDGALQNGKSASPRRSHGGAMPR